MISGEEATRKQTQAGFLIALVYGAAPCNSSRNQIIGPYTQDLVANGGPKLQRQLGAQPKKSNTYLSTLCTLLTLAVI